MRQRVATYKDAVQLAKDMGHVTLPMLQRFFHVGASDAAELLARMEREGIASKP